MRHPHRRVVALVLSALLGLALAACSTGSTVEQTSTPAAASAVDEGAFPVTIEHAHGATTMSAEPERVVTIGWSEHDFVLALGVVPVGASSVVWGGTDEGSTPWFDAHLAELGAEAPRRLSDADGVAFDEIAALEPDLILATYWDLSERDYRRLSRLAPVVAYPEAPYTTAWQTSLDLVGLALGRSSAAERLKSETEQQLAAASDAHPALEDTSFTFLGVSGADTSKVDYLTPLDPRSQVLESLGLEPAPAVRDLAEGNEAYFGSLSAERADALEADLAVVMPYDAMTAADLEQLFADNPLLGRIPPVAAGHWHPAVDPTLMLSLSGASPLSLPWALREVVPALAQIAPDPV